MKTYLLKQYIYIFIFFLFNQTYAQTTRLRPKIENAVRNLSKLFENPKAEDQVAIFKDISVLSKTLHKLEGWIKNPRHPERSQKKYLDDGLLMVKESAKFTQLKIDDEALRSLFGWTDKEFIDWIELKEKLETLRIKLFETVKLRFRRPATTPKPDITSQQEITK